MADMFVWLKGKPNLPLQLKQRQPYHLGYTTVVVQSHAIAQQMGYGPIGRMQRIVTIHVEVVGQGRRFELAGRLNMVVHACRLVNKVKCRNLEVAQLSQ